MSAPPRPADRPIVLVGLPGAGKTTVGRRLAERLGLGFVDGDEAIERAAGASVADIFARDGEASFRDLERRTMAALAGGPPRVIASGGGAFADPATRALVLARCVAVWLDAEPAALAARVGGGGRRPLVGADRPLASLQRLAAAREPAYAEAHLRVAAGDAPPAIVAERILAALTGRRA